MERDEARAAEERGDAAREDGDSYTEREQRLADADLAARERSLDDAERARDVEVSRAADADRASGREGILHHDDHPGVADHVGEAAGGIGGAVAGAAIGSLAGPVGTVIGGVIGAMGGWWTGRTIAEAATRISQSDEDYYRTHYESAPDRPPTWKYDDVQPAYYLGHLAGYNPGYAGREFDEIEPELERGWVSNAESSRADWTGVRSYARAGYTRGTTAARDAGWLSQPEAVRRGDSYELATPAGTNDAASRSPIEGEDLSPEAIDYMADNMNPQDNTQGSSGPSGSSPRASTGAEGRATMPPGEGATGIEAVPNADTSASVERERVADADVGATSAGYSGTSTPGAGAADRGSSNRAAGLSSTGDSGSFATGGGSAASVSGASSTASGGTGTGTNERPSFNDPVGSAGSAGDVANPNVGNTPPRSFDASRASQERARGVGDEDRARSLSDSDSRTGSADVERESGEGRRDAGPDAQF